MRQFIFIHSTSTYVVVAKNLKQAASQIRPALEEATKNFPRKVTLKELRLHHGKNYLLHMMAAVSEGGPKKSAVFATWGKLFATLIVPPEFSKLSPEDQGKTAKLMLPRITGDNWEVLDTEYSAYLLQAANIQVPPGTEYKKVG